MSKEYKEFSDNAFRDVCGLVGLTTEEASKPYPKTNYNWSVDAINDFDVETKQFMNIHLKDTLQELIDKQLDSIKSLIEKKCIELNIPLPNEVNKDLFFSTQKRDLNEGKTYWYRGNECNTRIVTIIAKPLEFNKNTSINLAGRFGLEYYYY